MGKGVILLRAVRYGGQVRARRMMRPQPQSTPRPSLRMGCAALLLTGANISLDTREHFRVVVVYSKDRMPPRLRAGDQLLVSASREGEVRTKSRVRIAGAAHAVA